MPKIAFQERLFYRFVSYPIQLGIIKEIDLFERGCLIVELEEVLQKCVDLMILNGLEKENPRLAFAIVDNHRLIFVVTMNAVSTSKRYL